MGIHSQRRTRGTAAYAAMHEERENVGKSAQVNYAVGTTAAKRDAVDFHGTGNQGRRKLVARLCATGIRNSGARFVAHRTRIEEETELLIS
jgi:hypothetical protein